MDRPPTTAFADERNVLFLSYSHGDRDMCDRLAKHLDRKARALGYEIWWDQALQPGREWRPQIAEMVARTRACIFLASLEAMSSDFIWEQELGPMLAAEVLVSPLYTRPFNWRSYPELERLGFLPPLHTDIALATQPPDEVEATMAQLSMSLADWLPALEVATSSRRRPADAEAASRAASEAIHGPGEVFGVPALPADYQARTAELARFKEALLAEGSGSAAIMTDRRMPPGTHSTVGLHGDGGTGKSVMAAAVATDDEVRRAFPHGIYWVTVGDKRPNVQARQEQLASWLGCDISHCRTSVDRRNVLAEALQDRRCLIVVDDVWTGHAADAFNIAGPLTRVLFTTRFEHLLSVPDIQARPLFVGRYDSKEALDFLARATDSDVSGSPEAQRVAFFTDGVVFALSLAAGSYRHGRSWNDLLTAFQDSQRLYPDDLDGNLRAMRVAVSGLSDDERRRYSSLAVFPSDTPIPVQTIRRLWEFADAEPEALLAKFEDGSLLHRDGDHVRFHDDQLLYLECNAEHPRHHHVDLLDSHRPASERWSDLNADEPYLWDHLVEHLVKADAIPEAWDLATDMRWIARRWSISGAGAVERDLGRLCETLPEKHRAQKLYRRLTQGAHLLTELTGEPEIANTLALHTVDIVTNVEPLRSLANQAWLHPSTPAWTGSDALVKVFNGHRGIVNAVVGLPPGARQLVASGGADGEVHVWDELVPDSESVALIGHEQAVMALCMVDFDGRPWLASADAHRRILLWDTADLEAQPIDLDVHASSVLALCSTGSEGRYFLASGGEDRTVRLWHADDPERPPLMVGRHFGAIVALDALPDPEGLMLLVATRDGRRTVWREQDSGRFERVAKRADAASLRAGARFIERADGAVIASSSDRHVMIWHPDAAEATLSTVGPLPASVQSLAVRYEDDARRLEIGGADGVVRLWDGSPGAGGLPAFYGHTDAVTDVCILRSDRLRVASASEDGSVCVWDPALADDEMSEDEGRTSRLTATAILQTDGATHLAAATASRRIVTWDLDSSRRAPLTSLDHDEVIRALHGVTVDGRPHIAFGDDIGRTSIIPVDETSAPTRLAGDHNRTIRALATFSSGGVPHVVTAGHDRTIVLHPCDGTAPHVLEGGHSNRIHALHAFDHDGAPLIASAGADGTVQLWDPVGRVARGPGVVLGSGQIDAICSLEIGDERLIAAGTEEGVVRLVHVSDTSAQVELRPRGDAVVSLATVPSPGGHALAVLTARGILEIWDTTSYAARMLTRVRVGQNALAVASLPRPGGMVVAFDASWTTLDLRQRRGDTAEAERPE